MTTGSFPHDNFSSVYWIFNKLGHMIPLWKGKNPIYFGVIKVKGQGHCYYKYNFWQQGRFRTITLVLYIGSLTYFGHMIPLLKGKNPIYFGVITIIPFDNLYRRAYFVMHTFLVCQWFEVRGDCSFCWHWWNCWH